MITDIKGLANVKAGEIADVAIDIKDFDDNIVPIIGTIKCNKMCGLFIACRQCVFSNTMDCANNEICCSKGRPDKEQVYFELINKE